MSYSKLPYLNNEDFSRTEYSKAAAMRTPIRDAVNSARSLPDDRMDQVIRILEEALAHIRQETQDAEFEEEAPAVDDVVDIDDPLNLLLGYPSENEPYTG